MIELRNLNKFFNKKKSNEIHVLKNINLTLPNKGFISILGHSGSGKSTLLNVISGIDNSKGDILFDDKKYNSNYQIDKFRRENIGFIFQNYNLIENETVFENLRMVLNIIGITDKDEVEKRIDYCLNAVGMIKYKKRYAKSLSGGEQQRVSIARALVKKSKIIIADEPTGNLDKKNSIEIMNILKKISNNYLVILVTHDRTLADFYSDRIVEIKDGSIVKDYENTFEGNLDVKDKNVIYLKDLHEKQLNEELNFLKVYYDEEIKDEIKIEVIVRNNNLYFSSNIDNLKIVNNSNITVKNEKYEDMNKDDFKDIVYSDESFVEKKNNLNIFSKFNSSFKESFIKIITSTRKQIFMLFGFVIIGFIFGLIMAITSTRNVVDKNSLLYYSDRIVISKENEFIDYPELKNNIKPFMFANNGYVLRFKYNSYIHDYNFDEFSISSGIGFIDEIDNSMLKKYSEIDNEKGIYLSRSTLDKVIKNYKSNGITSIYDLVDKKVTTDHYEFYIAGIVETEDQAIYYNKEYILNNFVYNNLFISYDNSLDKNVYKSNDINSDKNVILSDFTLVLDETLPNGKYLMSEETFQELILKNEFYKKLNVKYYNVDLNENDYDQNKLVGYYERLYNEKDTSNKKSFANIYVAIIVVVAINLFFLMRSIISNDIYKIAVKRVLGESKVSILSVYANYLFVLSLITSTIGYFLMVRAIYVFNGLIPDNLDEVLNARFYFPFWFVILGLFLMIITIIVIGLIPVVLLLRLKPAKIITKYDI